MSERLLRQPEVCARTGLSRTVIFRKRRAGVFPAPVRISDNVIGWHESDIDAWIRAREVAAPTWRKGDAA